MVLTIFTGRDSDIVRAALAFYHEALVDDKEDDPGHARGDEIDALEDLNYRFRFIQEVPG
jgi:hypothetical protein